MREEDEVQGAGVLGGVCGAGAGAWVCCVQGCCGEDEEEGRGWEEDWRRRTKREGTAGSGWAWLDLASVACLFSFYYSIFWLPVWYKLGDCSTLQSQPESAAPTKLSFGSLIPRRQGGKKKAVMQVMEKERSIWQ